MIVGGHAVAFHGHPRFTKDIDLFYRVTSENVERLRRDLLDFGFTSAEISKEEFLDLDNVLTVGAAPSRVDLLGRIDGVDYDDEAPNAVRGCYGNVDVNFIGRNELIRNKNSTSRARDRADAEELGGTSE